jgi:Zn-dependent protease with chaperone function
MMFALLGGSVALAAFAAATGLASAALAAAWPAFASMAGRAPAAARARLLYALRVLPVALSVIMAVALVARAWLVFEPRHASESLGPPLVATAGLGLLLLVAGAGRAFRSWRAGRDLSRRWMKEGTPVRLPGVALPSYRIVHPWPVVCVVGTLRPRLFVAEAVLESCTPDELASVLAHEIGHVAARDNLKRLFLKLLPDILAWIPSGRALEKAWENASEAAADARAAGARPGAALDLATALVRVARLATSAAWVELPARALLDGGSVAPRVQRLLEEEPAPARRARVLTAWAFLLSLPVALLVASREPSFLRTVQHAAEVLVQAR